MGFARDFDGTDDRITGTISELGTSTNWTIGCWFWLDTVPAANQSIIEIMNGATAVQWLFLNTSAEIRCRQSWSTTNSVVTGSVLSTGKWYFIVGTYRTASNANFIYVGDLATPMVDAEASTITGVGTRSASGTGVGIGAAYSSNIRNVDGKIAYPFCLNWELTLAEIEMVRQGSLKPLYRFGSVAKFLLEFSPNGARDHAAGAAYTIAGAADIDGPPVRMRWARRQSGLIVVTEAVTPVSATTIEAVASVGSSTVTASATRLAVTIAATATVGLPVVTASATRLATTVTAVASVGAPTITASALPEATTIEADATVGMAVTEIRPLATTIAATASVGVPTTVAATPAPAATVAAVASVGVPVVTTDPEPSTIAATATVGLPVVTASATVGVATIQGVATVGSPSLTSDSSTTVSATTIEAVASVGVPVTEALTPAPVATIAAVASVGAVSITASAVPEATTIEAVATVGEAAITASAVPEATTIEAVATVGLALAEALTPAPATTVAAVASVGAPTFNIGATPTPPTIQVTVTVGGGSLSSATAGPTITAVVSISAPTVIQQSTAQALAETVVARAVIPTPAVVISVVVLGALNRAQQALLDLLVAAIQDRGYAIARSYRSMCAPESPCCEYEVIVWWERMSPAWQNDDCPEPDMTAHLMFRGCYPLPGEQLESSGEFIHTPVDEFEDAAAIFTNIAEIGYMALTGARDLDGLRCNTPVRVVSTEAVCPSGGCAGVDWTVVVPMLPDLAPL